MKFIITGGNFNNKGAQAMTFITCSELRQRFPECTIIMADVCFVGKDSDSTLQFERIQDCLTTRMILGGNYIEKTIGRIILNLKSKKSHSDLGLKRMTDALNGCDAILDVSGYSVGSNISSKINLTYLMLLKIAAKHKIPLYLMPQSFGPLNYTSIIGKYIYNGLKKNLKNAKIIFAREREGFDLLKKCFGLKNVELAIDMVIQNKEIYYEAVRTNLKMKVFEELPKDEMVIGLIPSDNNYIFENNDRIDMYYHDLISCLISNGNTVCMAYHSGNDRKICQRIKEMFSDESKLIFIDEELEFYNFERLLDHFSYMISSRYHSIALAYKHKVPCVIFAWAVKYHEMAMCFEQTEYVVNIGNVKDASEIIEVVDKMSKNYSEEIEKIDCVLKKVQRGSCFERIFGKEVVNT